MSPTIRAAARSVNGQPSPCRTRSRNSRDADAGGPYARDHDDDADWPASAETGALPTIRDYRDTDEQSWLRCRVLSFLSSSYFDDADGRVATIDTESLHVYAREAEIDDGFTTPDGLSAPLTAFCHARLDDENRWRYRFSRVHRCRRYVRRSVE